MKPDPLDDLLNDYAKQPLPPPAAAGKTATWNRIATERQCSSWARLVPVVSWRDVFAEPRLAVAGLVVALLTGVVPVAAAAVWTETPQLARNSLHLDVFTTCPSCLSARLAADHRAR